MRVYGVHTKTINLLSNVFAVILTNCVFDRGIRQFLCFHVATNCSKFVTVKGK